MGNYRLEIARSAEKTLFKLPKGALVRVLSAIQGLAVEPRPDGCRKLSGIDDVYRIRVGVYRIIYEVHDDLILVKVLKIGHRKDIYR